MTALVPWQPASQNRSKLFASWATSLCHTTIGVQELAAAYSQSMCGYVSFIFLSRPTFSSTLFT
jgi:hypothetical protein